jgi:hypothetical protein
MLIIIEIPRMISEEMIFKFNVTTLVRSLGETADKLVVIFVFASFILNVNANIIVDYWFVKPYQIIIKLKLIFYLYLVSFFVGRF